MANFPLIIGIIVLLLGLVGLAGWLVAGQYIGEILGSLDELGKSLEQVDEIAKDIGLDLGVAETLSETVGLVALAITLFFYYNLMLNIALLLSGIALVLLSRKQ